MIFPRVRRPQAGLAIGLMTLVLGIAPQPSVGGGTRHPDATAIVPLNEIAPQHRESIVEVINSHTFHRQGAPDTFPCNPQLYLSLLNEPALTLALWKDLSTSPAKLRQVGPDRYEGTDGAGATAAWEFVYRSPRLHVLLCDLDYVGPRGNTHLNGRIVLIIHTDYYRKGQSEPWVKHDVEAYVKIDSRGWRTVAKTVRPIIEKLLEDQVQEAGWFVSLMGRLVELYPNWAADVALQGEEIRPEVRERFRSLVLQTRRPGASSGRPVLADNVATDTRAR